MEKQPDRTPHERAIQSNVLEVPAHGLLQLLAHQFGVPASHSLLDELPGFGPMREARATLQESW